MNESSPLVELSRDELMAIYESITPEQEAAVILYLEENKVLTSCPTREGCKGSCPQGQYCIRSVKGNCICRKA